MQDESKLHDRVVRALIVDDCTDAARTLARMLEVLGVRSVIAPTCLCALEVSRAATVRYAFLDVHGERDELEYFVHQFAADHPNSPIVLTALFEREIGPRARARANGRLPKPYSFHQLSDLMFRLDSEWLTRQGYDLESGVFDRPGLVATRSKREAGEKS